MLKGKKCFRSLLMMVFKPRIASPKVFKLDLSGVTLSSRNQF
jgi:hypothetical protein